ncbi:transposase [Patescibacteria group bacterium]
MPGRKIPLVTDQFYHVFNRGIDHRLTFINKKDYSRALVTLGYYQFVYPPMKLSRYLQLSVKRRKNVLIRKDRKEKKLVAIIAYCLMPNHYHLLVKQLSDGGISRFMSNLQNSYTRFFNVKNERVGPLFLDQFKAVRIETDEQLVHVSRYIHLNPFSSFIVKKIDNLKDYFGSSLSEYLNNQEGICEKDILLSFYNNLSEMKEFIWNQADYQKRLEGVMHLVLEKNP